MTIKNNIIIRAYCFYVIAITIGVLIIGKIIVIQLSSASINQETTNYIEIASIPGNIYSSDNKILATTIASYELRIDMNINHLDNNSYRNIIDSISTALYNTLPNIDKDDLKKKLWAARKSNNRYYLIKSNLGLQELQKLKKYAIFRDHNNKTGLIVKKKLKRTYPFKNMALRTIGYVHGDRSVGIEGAYNQYIIADNIKVPITQGLGGIKVPLDADYLGVQKGSDIVLTVDTRLQSILQEALLKALIDDQAQSGTAILMEVSTGKIKAISNFIKNTNNAYVESFNLAIGDSVEPGSTFKLASIMAGLEDKKFTITSLVDVENGSTKFYNRTLRDVTKPEKSQITIKEAFKHSSNVGVAKIIWNSYKNNPQQFIDKLNQFHMNDKLGIDIKGEGSAVIKTPKDPTWSQTSLPWMSIGYEVLQTPLHILTLYNAIANNAKMLKPQFVEQILTDGEVQQNFETMIIDKQICSDETLKQAQILLRETGASYTKKLGKDLHYSIAGKTGTAQIATLNKGYKIKGEKVRYRASFCGYFPADKPKYSMIVMINAPKKAYYGSQVAFPIFKEIANDIYMTTTTDFENIKNITLSK